MLRAFFEQCPDGSWVQQRLERERKAWTEKPANFSANASTAAKRGGIRAKMLRAMRPAMRPALLRQCRKHTLHLHLHKKQVQILSSIPPLVTVRWSASIRRTRGK